MSRIPITTPPVFMPMKKAILGWLPAMEADVAALSVHAKIWPEGDDRAGIHGDAIRRQSYHQVLKSLLPDAPKPIVDLGSSAGLSTFALQETFPDAELTQVDLSPYFVAMAHYAAQQKSAQQLSNNIRWVHAAAEHTSQSAWSLCVWCFTNCPRVLLTTS